MAQDEPERQSIEDILGKQSSSRSASPKRTDESSPRPPADGRGRGDDESGRQRDESGGDGPSRRGTGKTVAALVCGGIGIVAALLVPLAGLLLGIAAITLAVLDRRSGRSDGRTTAGLALGGLAIVASIAIFSVTLASGGDKDKEDSDKKEKKDKKDSDGKDTKKDGE